ncbi:MAG: isoprenylcysteine carboxylmethyltransferase family protein [Dissulfurispiraceae bacterium]|nr:isoprenylcysteine carboxylmethyltransferase family protein [Dissulfurispiraceae bacterium]
MQFVLIFLFSLLFPLYSEAADVQLTLTQNVSSDNVVVILRNESGHSVNLHSVQVDFDGSRYFKSAQSPVEPYGVLQFTFDLKKPKALGTYPVISTVRYFNEGWLLSIKNAGEYHHGEPSLYQAECAVPEIHVATEQRVVISHDSIARWRMELPDEIKIASVSRRPASSEYLLENTAQGFRNRYDYYFVAELDQPDRHSALLCRGVLTTLPDSGGNKGGWLPGTLYAYSALAGLIMTVAISRIRKATPLRSAGLKYTSRLFFLSLCCYLLVTADSFLLFTLQHISWRPSQVVAAQLLVHFQGSNYAGFFTYFIEPYFIVCAALMLPYLYFFDKNCAVDNDKYVSLMKSIQSLPCVLVGGKPFWTRQSRLALLIIIVKVFFIPYMVSWTINGIRSIDHLHTAFTFQTLNAFMVQTLLLIDTFIFGFGYSFESKHLRNEIKSVDPTLFGWLVCIMCYPPFNSFVFKPFDYRIFDISVKTPDWIGVLAGLVVTFLWIIFVWASVALGFKASNLTNRGVTSRGPYKYVRHPAYTAKVLIWILQGIFFNQFTLGILLAFTFVYYLRAWTEERHLSMDPAYKVYKQNVRWRFIPGIY